MRIFNIPIENIEERYSSQWNEWFPIEFNRLDVDALTIHGRQLTSKIEEGSFLDVCGTNYFKATQLQRIVEMIYSGGVRDGDVFFFHDLWFPGIEMLAYIRDGLGLEFKIFGCLHAGTYDPYDFLAQRGMGRWAEDIENGWFKFIDGIFVATSFHKQMLSNSRDVDFKKIHVTGFPIYWKYGTDWDEKEDVVVFPHRLDPEKVPEDFATLEEKLKETGLFNDWRFIRTMDDWNKQSGLLTESEKKIYYYRSLQKAKIAVSFAMQETWGIAMQEAAFSGCLPFVPNRLSYPELYDVRFVFSDIEDLVRRISLYIEGPAYYRHSLINNRRVLIEKGEAAIPKMINIMRRANG